MGFNPRWSSDPWLGWFGDTCFFRKLPFETSGTWHHLAWLWLRMIYGLLYPDAAQGKFLRWSSSLIFHRFHKVDIVLTREQVRELISKYNHSESLLITLILYYYIWCLSIFNIQRVQHYTMNVLRHLHRSWGVDGREHLVFPPKNSWEKPWTNPVSPVLVELVGSGWCPWGCVFYAIGD